MHLSTRNGAITCPFVTLTLVGVSSPQRKQTPTESDTVGMISTAGLAAAAAAAAASCVCVCVRVCSYIRIYISYIS